MTRSLTLVFMTLLLFLPSCTDDTGQAATTPQTETLHKGISLPERLWINPSRIAELPKSGEAWQRLKQAAAGPVTMPDLSEQHSEANVRILAKALAYVKTGKEQYRDEVADACMVIRGTQRGGRSLALAKQLLSYVIAADLVGLPSDQETKFKRWLGDCLSYEFSSGKTLRSTHEHRPNNWGTLAGASRLAAAAYLDDKEEVKRCAEVFKGWLGDRDLYAGFEYKDRSWQAEPRRPVGINPKGATKKDRSIDGVLPDDQRRGGSFQWPPPKENYAYTALQGAVAQAVILDRCGYDVWQWEDKALLRAFKWLYDVADYPAEGNDMWMPYIINKAYNASLPVNTIEKPGKNVAWTDWTHQDLNNASSQQETEREED